MTRSEKKEQEIPGSLHTKTGGKTGRCTRMTEADGNTIQEWVPGGEDFPSDDSGSSGLPPTGKIKEKIIRRVYQIIDECNDPKKLMDAYEAMTKLEERIGPKESIFDVVERNLREDTTG